MPENDPECDSRGKILWSCYNDVSTIRSLLVHVCNICIIDWVTPFSMLPTDNLHVSLLWTKSNSLEMVTLVVQGNPITRMLMTILSALQYPSFVICSKCISVKLMEVHKKLILFRQNIRIVSVPHCTGLVSKLSMGGDWPSKHRSIKWKNTSHIVRSYQTSFSVLSTDFLWLWHLMISLPCLIL